MDRAMYQAIDDCDVIASVIVYPVITHIITMYYENHNGSYIAAIFL